MNKLDVIPDSRSNLDFSCSQGKNLASVQLLTYLKKLKLQKIFLLAVTDPRQGKVTYTLESLIQTAMATVLFRMGSKNAFHKEGRTSEAAEASIAKFCGIDSGKLPVTKTIDDVLKNLDHEEMNEVLMRVFEILRKDKFFSDHSALIPGNKYHLAIDAESTHKYTLDSDHDCVTCPFCLKRQRGEEIWYLHMHVAVSLVCPGGIRIPLYLYPIHAKSLSCDETTSPEKFKQECELGAFPLILNKIRERFPRLKFCILVDSLYANGPAIKILKATRMEFMIVRKDGSMKTVGQDCDGLEKIPDDKTTGQIEETGIENGKKIKRSYRFFNEIDYQNLKLNVLRFEEAIFDKNENKFGYVRWEWLVSWRLTKRNAFLTASRGRMRWLEEDLFNTLKNRGFRIKHDYSRNSSSQIIWCILIMLAFLVTELFVLTRQIVSIKRNRSLKDFMRSIFYELRHLYEKIFKEQIPQRKTQFRYCFEKTYFSLNHKKRFIAKEHVENN